MVNKVSGIMYIRTYIRTYIFTHPIMYVHTYLYPGEGTNYGWIKGKSVLTLVMQHRSLIYAHFLIDVN